MCIDATLDRDASTVSEFSQVDLLSKRRDIAMLDTLRARRVKFELSICDGPFNAWH